MKRKTPQHTIQQGTTIGSTSYVFSSVLLGRWKPNNPSLKRQYPELGLVMVDYLQLMTVHGKAENRVQEISEISRSLKSLAKEINVPVIAISQLNRGVESRTKTGKGRMPQMADLRESGSIEQDADIIGFIYRDELYHDDAYTNPEEVGKAD